MQPPEHAESRRSAPSPVAQTWFGESELPGLRDFWSVYQDCWRTAFEDTMALVLEHPQLGPIVRAMDPAIVEARSQAARARMQRAIDGQWDEYEHELRSQGRTYAAMGIAFGDWYAIVRAFTKCVMPRLVRELAADPPRLTAALLVMHKLLDNAMSIVAEAYIESKAIALQASEQRLSITLDSIADAVIATDREGRVSLLNPIAESLTGWSRADAVGRPLAEVFRIRDGHTGLPAVDPAGHVLTQGTVVGLPEQTLLLARDGDTRSIADSASPIRARDGSIEGVVLVFRDVTGEHAAAAALRTSEARGAAVLDSALEAVVMMDVHGDIIEFNPSAERIFGHRRADVLGRSLDEVLVPPAYREKHRSGLARYLVTGEQHVLGRNLELPAMRADGTEFPAEVSVVRIELPGPPMFTGFIRDISDRKRSEAALRRAEERFLRLCGSSVVGIMVGDFSGVVSEANDAFLAIVGRTRDELDRAVVHWAEPADPEHGDTDLAVIEQLQRTGGAPSWEREFQRPDGESVPVLIGVTMCEPPSFVAVVLDLSERKHLEQAQARHAELELESRRAQDASRLKSEFLANMSHELRTPLNAIIGFTELIHDGEVSPEMPQFQEFLGDILTSGRHLLQLINDVLDLSKVEAGKLEFQPELLDLERVFGEVLAILRTTAAGKRIRIESHVDPAVRTVLLDGARLKQVLYNYLSNALKFTGEGGKVSLRALASGDESFCIEVVDTGVGIHEADLPRLFVEFSQLDGAAKQRRIGTGLGLALTKKLVVAQGGEVGVESEPGKGSRFFAVLPRHARVGTPLPPPRAYPSRRADAPSVLVIEDDARDQALLVGTLGEAGYAVETAASGAQALASCRTRHFDAIVLDLLLPDIGGLQLLRRLRNEGSHPDVPVVVVTVVTEHGVADGFAVHDVLPKPPDGAALLAALTRAGVAADVDVTVLVVAPERIGRAQ